MRYDTCWITCRIWQEEEIIKYLKEKGAQVPFFYEQKFKMNIEELYHLFREHPVVSTDSRNIPEGAIFLALKGDTFDGNAFASKALESGASYAVIDNKKHKVNDKAILVENVLTSLQELANYHRNQFKIPVLAITGTNGKTTTKELIQTVLSQKYNVLFTKGNLNNHIGVPLTLLNLNNNHEIAVIEMGANHQHEIGQLCKIAEPTHGLITNIGKAHLEGFGGFEGVIKTKKELYEFIIQYNGTLFYNSDNELLTGLIKYESVRKISYGPKSGENFKGRILDSNPFLKVEIASNDFTIQVFSKLIGAYNFENLMAAACVGNFFGVPAGMIKNALEEYQPSNSRSQLTVTEKNRLIVDCYNANPSSTEVALQNFSTMSDGEKLVILGDMLELGTESDSEHERILRLTQDLGLNTLFIGNQYQHISKGYSVRCFGDVDELYNWLQQNEVKAKTILIKGSRGIKLEKIIPLL